MTIELDDKSYVVGMWFSSDPKTNNDWLACMIKDPNNPKKYKGWSRFRYTKDDKIFDSEDEKSWTNFESSDTNTEDEIIAIMDSMQNAIETGYPVKDKMIVKGSLKKLIELSKSKSWMNIKMVEAPKNE
jgi:hypothetical protein